MTLSHKALDVEGPVEGQPEHDSLSHANTLPIGSITTKLSENRHITMIQDGECPCFYYANTVCSLQKPRRQIWALVKLATTFHHTNQYSLPHTYRRSGEANSLVIGVSLLTRSPST